MRKTANPLPAMIFRLLQISALIGVTLSITGTTKNFSISHMMVNTETKFGLIFYIICWIGVFGLFLPILQRAQSIEDGEHRLLLAVGISLPLILVRLIYSLIFSFGHKAEFDAMSGNITIQLVMSILEEMLVVFVCLGIGFTLQVRPATEYTQQINVYGEEHSGARE
ncbi:hypothetical protein PDIDSM_7173 [Penicillium digitatum]|nr:hypothetical protein PDIDSM_7173 [Penicillium digitatum]